MRKATGLDVGDWAEISIEFDPVVRITSMPSKLHAALNKNKKDIQVFERLPPSRRKEITRYIGFLKSEKVVDKNVERAIQFLRGKRRFIESFYKLMNSMQAAQRKIIFINCATSGDFISI